MWLQCEILAAFLEELNKPRLPALLCPRAPAIPSTSFSTSGGGGWWLRCAWTQQKLQSSLCFPDETLNLLP